MEAAVAALARGANVCFDADGVLWREDVGNSYLLSQIERHVLLPEEENEARRAWDAYCRGELEDGRLAALCATLMRGLREEFVAADALEFFRRSFTQFIVPKVQEWITRLQARGVNCWVVSGSHRWIVTAGAEVMGIPEERVLAVATAVRDGVLTGDLLHPFPYGPGKAEAIRLRLGRAPEMAFGNTASDIPMLEMATCLAVAVEPDAELARVARERGWAIINPV